MIPLILAVLVVLISSAFCSGTEAALFTVSMVKARKALENNRYGSRQLVQILENMNRPIATIVVLNNIANIVGSITVGALAAHALGNEWLGIFSGVLTLLIIVFSEIIPKTLGELYSERVALQVAPSILVMTRMLSPIVWLLERITAPITRGKTNLTTNEAEIRLLAQIGLDEGVIEDDEAQMLQQVFKLNDTTAQDLMTPRIAMTYLNGGDALKDAKDFIISSQHSRLIIVGDTPDHVLGFALKSQLLAALINGDGSEPIADHHTSVQHVSEGIAADDLLTTFQRSKQHIALVEDAYGGVAGVVSLEDVLEVLTGEIVDETDQVVDMQQAARQKILLEPQAIDALKG